MDGTYTSDGGVEGRLQSPKWGPGGTGCNWLLKLVSVRANM